MTHVQDVEAAVCEHHPLAAPLRFAHDSDRLRPREDLPGGLAPGRTRGSPPTAHDSLGSGTGGSFRTCFSFGDFPRPSIDSIA